MLLHDKIRLELASILKDAIKLAFDNKEIKISEIYQKIGPAPEFKFAHYAFGAFFLAKELRQGPPIIAKKIVENIKLPNDDYEVVAKGPYVNFKLRAASYASKTTGRILSGEFFKEALIEKAPRTMVEYSQPNTHKEMHVGHMRNLALGHSLVLLLKYCNYDVIGVTYPGDSGTHVAKCLWYLKNKFEGKIPDTDKGSFLSEIYVSATALLDSYDEDEKKETHKIMAYILSEMEQEKGEYYDLWRETRQWSLDLMQEVYDFSDVSFDRWFFESEVDSDSLKYANKLHEEGILVKDDGAIGMDLSDDKLGFCLMIKRDGNGLYATKDVELARKKFEEFKVEQNIYVVDVRQSHHFKQVFKVLEKIGFEHADKCYHLAYDFVELPEGAMSSRAGRVVQLKDLILNMQSTIIDRYLEKYRGDWEDTEIEETAKTIARGAIHYGMLATDPNKKIVFDMDEWLKLDGESGPYLQYVYARIQSLLEKQAYDTSKEINWSKLDLELEEELLYTLSLFNNICEAATLNYRPSQLCHYLYGLARLFNRFYAECPISKIKDEELKVARLALSNAIKITIKEGLALLGIPCPQRM